MKTLLIFAIVIGLIALVSFASYRRRQTSKMLVEDFLSMLSSSFHEIKWDLELKENQNNIKSSPDFLAHQIIIRLRPLIENDLKQMLLCLHCFPSGKFKYFSGDETTNRFVKMTLTQIKKLQEATFYDQLPQKEVIENFFKTMEKNIQTLLSKDT